MIFEKIRLNGSKIGLLIKMCNDTPSYNILFIPGHGEKSRWLKEMGVNLNYVYAVEPNHNHAQRTKTTLQTLGELSRAKPA